MQRRSTRDFVDATSSCEVEEVMKNADIVVGRDGEEYNNCYDEREEMVSIHKFRAIERERNQLRCLYRELAAKIEFTRDPQMEEMALEGSDDHEEEGVGVGVVEGAEVLPVDVQDSVESEKETAFRHLEEQISFLVHEVTTMVRASKEKEREVANLHGIIERRNMTIKQMKQEIVALQEEVDILNGKLRRVECDRNKMVDEREEVMSMMQSCVTLGEEMDGVVTNVNELMRVLWDNFAKLETMDVQLLANGKHCSHIQDLIQVLNRDKRKVDIVFQTQLERKNKALEECLAETMRELKVMRQLQSRLEGTKK